MKSSGLHLKTNLLDGTPWTDGDIKDVKNEIEHGRSLESSPNEMRRKAAELGLGMRMTSFPGV